MSLRLIDAALLAWQGAAKRVGLMDGDEAGVRREQRPDGPWLVLDRDPEGGWPALRLRLPPASHQMYAVRGLCTRGAVWASEWPRAEAMAFLRRELGRQGIRFDEDDRKRHAELDALQLRIKVRQRDGGSRLDIMQKRSGESAASGAKRATLQTDCGPA